MPTSPPVALFHRPGWRYNIGELLATDYTTKETNRLNCCVGRRFVTQVGGNPRTYIITLHHSFHHNYPPSLPSFLTIHHHIIKTNQTYGITTTITSTTPVALIPSITIPPPPAPPTDPPPLFPPQLPPSPSSTLPPSHLPPVGDYISNFLHSFLFKGLWISVTIKTESGGRMNSSVVTVGVLDIYV